MTMKNLPTPLYRSNPPFLVGVLVLALLVACMYTYKLTSNVQHHQRDIVGLRGQLREALMQKTNYETRSQRCTLRVQEIEEMKKVAEDDTHAEADKNKMCQSKAEGLQNDVSKFTEEIKVMKLLETAISQALFGDAATPREGFLHKIKDIKDALASCTPALDGAKQEIASLEKKKEDIAGKLVSCESESKKPDESKEVTLKDEPKPKPFESDSETEKPDEIQKGAPVAQDA